MNILLVALGGFFGSVLRYYFSTVFVEKRLATLLVNCTGSVLFVFIFKLYDGNLITEAIWLSLGVGFCGAYTTYSTFGNETFTYILEHKYKAAFIYVLQTFLISIIPVSLILSL